MATNEERRSVLREYLEALLIAAVFLGFTNTFVVKTFYIPSGSMEETLLIGDHLFVNRFIYAPAPTALERALLPSRTPPHRNAEPRASAFHRFAMAALAAAERGMSVSDLEVRREGPSYTALTLEALHREGFAPAQLFFITGSDAFADVATWYDYPRILQLANFVVVSRPGAPRPSELIPNPQSLIPGAPTVLSVEADTPNVSSTEIRRRVHSNERNTLKA